MGLFDFLKPKPKPRPQAPASSLPFASPEDMAHASYGLAYYFLPSFAHRDFDQFLQLWRRSDPPFAATLCAVVLSKENLQPTRDQLAAFKTQDGQLSPTCDFYLIQFPPPPPFTGDITQLEAILASGGKPPVLAPYFAIVLADRAKPQRSLYILGQSPTGGTTFRSVTADGTNCNLGPGPEPTTSAFLERVQKQLAANSEA